MVLARSYPGIARHARHDIVLTSCEPGC